MATQHAGAVSGTESLRTGIKSAPSLHERSIDRDADVNRGIKQVRRTGSRSVDRSYKTGMLRNAGFLISASVMRRDVLSRVGGGVEPGVGRLRLRLHLLIDMAQLLLQRFDLALLFEHGAVQCVEHVVHQRDACFEVVEAFGLS
jgi:hypothetical protein